MPLKLLPYSAVLFTALILLTATPVLAEDAMTTTAANEAPGATALVVSPAPSAKVTPSPKAKATTAPKLIAKTATSSADRMMMIATSGGTLKDKLKTFKDQKKAAIIERISAALTNVNQKRTTAMLKNVDTMTVILGKAQERANAASSEGKDVSGVTSDMTSATNALANAKTAVETQSKKVYEIKIASESGAKADVKLTRDALEKDLKSTHELVGEARRTLINAIIKLAQALGEQVNAAN